MKEYKILFSGTAGAGKTTAIAAISETRVLSTDVANNDESLAKATTTVGLDFGSIMLDSGERIRLFGTPGQSRFDFMWGILAKDALGLVLLIDNSRPDPLADLEVYLDGFAAQLEHMPCVVGVGRCETHPEPGIDAFADRLHARGLVLPVVPADVRRRDDVLMLIDILLSQAEAGLAQDAA
jgi:signal recognition particle receptor subunit beta